MSEQGRLVLKWAYSGAILIILGISCFLAIEGFGARYFSPECGNNDLLQQGFQFFRANHPEIFAEDLVYESMRGYLPPLHYLLGLLITLPTDNPMLTGHILTTIQLALTVGFIFLIVFRQVGLLPAALAVIWFLHSRSLVHLVVGGLPRGWLAPCITGYLWALTAGNARGLRWPAWMALSLSALLNPLACLLSLTTHGVFLLLRWLTVGSSHERQAVIRREWIPFAGIALALLITLQLTTTRPPEIGSMMSLAEASKLQAFNRIGGRFPILPFDKPWDELARVGMQPFSGYWQFIPEEVQSLMPIFAVTLLGAFLTGLIALRRRMPLELLCYTAAVISIYALSRLVAFKLYIPERYLGLPLGFVWIVVGSVFLARILQGSRQSLYQAPRASRWALIPFSCVALLVLGFNSVAKPGKQPEFFDVCYSSYGPMWDYFQAETPENVLVAGHPTTIDGILLFGRRRGYITTETGHPFYHTYYAEVKRRIEVTYKAHYAHSWQELYAVLAPEKIDYFVFRGRDIEPAAARNATYEIPWKRMVERLARQPYERYVFSKIPAEKSPDLPFLVFRSPYAAVIDVKALGNFLAASAQEPSL